MGDARRTQGMSHGWGDILCVSCTVCCGFGRGEWGHAHGETSMLWGCSSSPCSAPWAHGDGGAQPSDISFTFHQLAKPAMRAGSTLCSQTTARSRTIPRHRLASTSPWAASASGTGRAGGSSQSRRGASNHRYRKPEISGGRMPGPCSTSRFGRSCPASGGGCAPWCPPQRRRCPRGEQPRLGAGQARARAARPGLLQELRAPAAPCPWG